MSQSLRLRVGSFTVRVRATDFLHRNNVIEKGRILIHIHVNVCKRGEDKEEGQGIYLSIFPSRPLPLWPVPMPMPMNVTKTLTMTMISTV